MEKRSERVQDKLAEFRKCVTVVYEPDEKRVLDTLRYIMSMPEEEVARGTEPVAG